MHTRNSNIPQKLTIIMSSFHRRRTTMLTESPVAGDSWVCVDRAVLICCVLTRFTGLEFEKDLNTYLAGLESTPVKTLKDLVQWNKEHSDLEMPPGKLATNPISIAGLLTSHLLRQGQSKPPRGCCRTNSDGGGSRGIAYIHASYCRHRRSGARVRQVCVRRPARTCR